MTLQRPFQFNLELFGTIFSFFCFPIILPVDFLGRIERYVLYFS